jgi:hypothetical protein
MGPQRWNTGNLLLALPDAMIPASELAKYDLIKDPDKAIQLIAFEIAQPAARTAISQVYQVLVGPFAARVLAQPRAQADKEILAALRDAVRMDRLLVLEYRRASAGGSKKDGDSTGAGGGGRGQGAGAAGAGGKSSSSEKTWIEIRLVDEYDNPVPGKKYKLKITDGSIREGTLGEDGSVRVSNIDPGTCEVSFPEIDASEWKKI